MLTIVAILVFGLSLSVSQESNSHQDAMELPVGELQTAHLEAGESHLYRIHSAAGDRIEGKAIPCGAMVALTLENRHGKALHEFEFFSNEVIPFGFRAKAKGDYYLRIRNNGGFAGDYQLHLGMAAQQGSTPMEWAEQYLGQFPSKLPGMVVAVLQDDELLFQKSIGVGRSEVGTPLDDKSIFPFPHLHRQFFIYAIHCLIEEGKLRLNQSLADVLPELAGLHDPLTVGHLLNRRSGVRCMLGLYRLQEGDEMATPTYEQCLTLLRSQTELNSAPGESIDSDEAHQVVLRRLIAEVSKQPYEDWVKENIFKPFQMSSAQFMTADQDSPNLVHLYDWQETRWERRELTHDFLAYPAISMQDWILWRRALSRRTQDGSSWWDTMKKFGEDKDSNACNGADPRILKRHHAEILTLSSTNDLGIDDISYTLAKILFLEKEWPIDLPDGGWQNMVGIGGGGSRPKPLSPEKFQDLVGTYNSTEINLRLVLKIVEGKLVAIHPKAGEIPLKPTSQTRFSAKTPLFGSFTFEDLRAGKVRELRLAGDGFSNLLFERVE